MNARNRASFRSASVVAMFSLAVEQCVAREPPSNAGLKWLIVHGVPLNADVHRTGKLRPVQVPDSFPWFSALPQSLFDLLARLPDFRCIVIEPVFVNDRLMRFEPSPQRLGDCTQVCSPLRIPVPCVCIRNIPFCFTPTNHNSPPSSLSVLSASAHTPHVLHPCGSPLENLAGRGNAPP